MTEHATLADTIAYQLVHIIRLKRKLIDKDLKALDLTRMGWQTLCHLSRLSPCTQKVLLENMDCDPGQLSRVLDCLEQKNHIQRQRDKSDKRSLLIQLTPKAHKEVLIHVEQSIDKQSQSMLRGLESKEVGELIRLLHKLEENLVNTK